MDSTDRIRLLTAVPICDGHDSAITTINLELVRQGFEVVYLGFHRPVSEIVAYEMLGFAENGRGKEVAERGDTMLKKVGGTGKLFPVNPGGGLMGDGHPVGATGVRQLHEMFVQLSGQAGERQIEGATRYLTFNMGGSFTTSVCAIWGV